MTAEERKERVLDLLKLCFENTVTAHERKSLLDLAFKSTKDDGVLDLIDFNGNAFTFRTSLWQQLERYDTDALIRFLENGLRPNVGVDNQGRIDAFISVLSVARRKSSPSIPRMYRFDLEEQESLCEAHIGCEHCVIGLAVYCRFDEFQPHLERRLGVLLGLNRTSFRTIINLADGFDEIAEDGLKDAVSELDERHVIQPFRVSGQFDGEDATQKLIQRAKELTAGGKPRKLVILFYSSESACIPPEIPLLPAPDFGETVFYNWAKPLVLQELQWELATAQLWRKHYHAYCIKEQSINLRRVYDHLKTFTELIDTACDEQQFRLELENWRVKKNYVLQS